MATTSPSIQIVELLYRQPSICDYASVKARAQTILGDELDSPEQASPNKAFLIVHKNHLVNYSDKKMPALTAILTNDFAPDISKYEQEVQQSRRSPGAGELLRGCVSQRLVTEFMAQSLAAKTRIALFHGVLQAMIETTNPDALVFKHSQQVIAPIDYMSAIEKDPILRPGSLNVRMFNISNSVGDIIMDTRGLCELGLPDLQCHYRNLHPGRVAAVLYNTAIYCFENGPVIQSGETVAGIEPGSKWLCQYEDSMLEPKRTVLDLNPGIGFAAGHR